jgi:hypothetical protein
VNAVTDLNEIPDERRESDQRRGNCYRVHVAKTRRQTSWDELRTLPRVDINLVRNKSGNPGISALHYRFGRPTLGYNGIARPTTPLSSATDEIAQPQVGADPTEDANGVGVMQDVCAE